MYRHAKLWAETLRRNIQLFAAALLLVLGALLLKSALEPTIKSYFLGHQDIRKIRACVLNDNQAPAPENVLALMLSIVFHEYEEKTGIKFVVKSKAHYDTEMLLIDGIFAYFSTLCPPDTEARYAFTGKRIRRENGRKRFLLNHEKYLDDDKSAESDPKYGVVILYATRGHSRVVNSVGRPVAIDALLHETAHLFKVPHHDDSPNSFMYHKLGSRGEWTPRTINNILENKYHRWNNSAQNSAN